MTPFYKKALALFTRTQDAQIQKGLAKYPEPFTPSHWTPEQLLNHALEETVDLTHYLVGLKELLDEKDEQIANLHRHWSKAMDELALYRKHYPNAFAKYSRKSPFEEQYDLNFNPVIRYSSQDDQY